MRSLDSARKLGQTLANKDGLPYVIWMIGWRTFLLPDGRDVEGGIVVEYINPKQTEETQA